MRNFRLRIAFLASVSFLISFSGCASDKAKPVSTKEPVAWHDPSPHAIQFVTVDDKNNVRLEVLDWGGSGRPLVLLAGLGNTAHVFDDFAPKLTTSYHVYGITRRGFGASSSPVPVNNNYSADQLGDDVLAVIDALKLVRPVLAGHSIAGEELSSVGTRHPERISGLIYLDAGYSYAYYDPAQGDFDIDVRELRRELDQFQPNSDLSDKKNLVRQMLRQDVPRFERELEGLQELQKAPQPSSPPSPSSADLASFTAFRSWEIRFEGVAVPEGELRQQFELTPEGGVGKGRDYQTASSAVVAGEEKFSGVPSPTLAIFVVPHDLGPFMESDPASRELKRILDDNDLRQEKAFQSGCRSAHVVVMANTNHYLFVSNEANVLREMRAFIATLH